MGHFLDHSVYYR